ncbi:MAG: hypothetical protein KIT84_23905 [Labilithrix sp.]|nr:hypothetical protein [Labilithrix sp.]MCW5814094.1 hypothetical protein [Labilithrix sp.]
MATQTGKAKRIDVRPAKPSVARTEIVDKATRARFEDELDAALKRKPASEVKLGGALRAIGRLSPALRGTIAEAASVMVRRGSFARELYAASIRTVAEENDPRAATILKAALAADDAGGNATLSAACFCRDTSLAAPLGKLAASRQSHLAFGAETARVCRRESNGAHLTAIAPMIKESHRISLCVDLFVPLTRAEPIAVSVGPALAVLRGAERHLGRWLVLADVAAKAGDDGPFLEATQKANVGPTSARAAWSLVSWALAETRASVTPNAPAVPSPATRPTVELVARLSDRPSADRDTTFLFRMAHARAPSCKPMLEGLAKTTPLADEVAVRAASYLARDHGRDDMRAALVECALDGKRDELRGLAVAALWDSASGPERAAVRQKARDLSDELTTSRSLTSVAWGALVRAAHATHREADFVVTSETALRWIQWGWLE